MLKISMSGLCSTVKVMEYIRDHGWYPTNGYGNMYFEFYEDKANYRIFGVQPHSIIVSEEKEERGFLWWLDEHPVETWHEVFGMKRYAIGEQQWYAYINGKYYYMTSD